MPTTREWWLVVASQLTGLTVLWAVAVFLHQVTVAVGLPPWQSSWSPLAAIALYAALYWPVLPGLGTTVLLGLLVTAFDPVALETRIVLIVAAWAIPFWLRARIRRELPNHVRMAALVGQGAIFALEGLFSYAAIVPWTRVLSDLAVNLLIAAFVLAPGVHLLRRLVLQLDPVAAMKAKKASASGA